MFLIDLIFSSSESLNDNKLPMKGQLRACLTEQVLRIERQLMAASQFNEASSSATGSA